MGKTDLSNKFESIVHKRFGDLGRCDSVFLKDGFAGWGSYRERSPLYIHVSVTSRCNAGCKGCINSYFEDNQRNGELFGDVKPERDSKAVLELLMDERGQEVIICLYGGEPMLRMEKVVELSERLELNGSGMDFSYMLYTNGEYLKDAVDEYPDFMEKVKLLSVSIDGRKKQHESVRKGTHLEKIHEGLKAYEKIREGEVLMWSTLREEQSLGDCFLEFKELYNQGLVDQFYWHWVESGEPFADLEGYAEKYEYEFEKIMARYVEEMQNGRVLQICHLNELILFFLSDAKRKGSVCEVELKRNYDIMGGEVFPCADLPEEWKLGDILEDGKVELSDRDLSSLTDYKDKLGCYSCGIHEYCGGRCPVEAMTGGDKRLFQYCQLMRLHVGIAKKYVREIAEYLEKNDISLQELYDRSAFYAQFTDVTP